jgi:hypothetical protein
LRLLNGESCVFSFDAFPVDDLVPQTMDRVQCRIFEEYVAYDIWPLTQSKHAKEMEIVTDRLQSVTNAAVEKLKAANVETRAVTEQLKEVSAPLREMYKDPSMAAVRTAAMREKVPDWIVDTIVSHHFKEGFPSKGILFKDLASSGGLEILKASDKGSSIQTIARWLGIVRRHMENRGFIEKKQQSKGMPRRTMESYDPERRAHQQPDITPDDDKSE